MIEKLPDRPPVEIVHAYPRCTVGIENGWVFQPWYN